MIPFFKFTEYIGSNDNKLRHFISSNEIYCHKTFMNKLMGIYDFYCKTSTIINDIKTGFIQHEVINSTHTCHVNHFISVRGNRKVTKENVISFFGFYRANDFAAHEKIEINSVLFSSQLKCDFSSLILIECHL